MYGVRTIEPRTLLLGCLGLAGAAVVASMLPALRAVRVSPSLALRAK